jgi:hypothetical protein
VAALAAALITGEPSGGLGAGGIDTDALSPARLLSG